MNSSELLARPPDAALPDAVTAGVAPLDAVAAERVRIGHDLHDGVQHHIVAALLCLRLAERELTGREPAGGAGPDGRDLLGRAARGLTASLAELRAVLDATTGDGTDLAARLRQLAADSPIPVAVRLDGRGRLSRLDAEFGRTAFRVVAEALTNTMKHSGAQTAEVSLSADHGSVWIRVRDDGHGRLASRPPAALARLVREAGGELTVSGSRRGTVVTARLPRELPRERPRP